MPLRTVPMDASKLQFYFLASTPKLGEDDEQIMNPDGQPMWRVSVLAVAEGQDSTILVTIPGQPKQILGQEVAKLAQIQLIGIRAGTYAQRDGANFYYQADAMTPFASAARNAGGEK